LEVCYEKLRASFYHFWFVSTRFGFAQSKSSVSPSEINPLEFGNAIEREILPKQKHFYKIHLETGQFVKISVISRNCTIAVSIFEPDGKFVLESKNIHLTNNDETINAAVRKTGDYQVRIVFAEKTDAAASYRLNITELRAANEIEFSYTDSRKIVSETELLIKSDLSFDNMQAAVKKYQEAVGKFQIAQTKKLEAAALESIGILLTKLGERRKAIETHERSIKIFRAIGDKKLLSRALNNLGRVHSLLGERGQALEILAEALALAKEAKNKTSEAIALNGIGAIHYRLDDAARAEIYHIAALKLFEETEDVYNQSFTQTYLGNCANHTQNYQKAV